MPRLDILERKEDILEWIGQGLPKSYICRQLGCKPETLNSYLKKMNIQYAGNTALKGHSELKNLRKTAEEYSKSDGYISSCKLKEKLLEDGVKERKCEICGNSEWNGQQIPLELHHIDGDHYNNDFQNLMILCPNCHAQQSNNSAKNIHSYIKKIPLKEEKDKIEQPYIKNSNLIKKNLEELSKEDFKKEVRENTFTDISREYDVGVSTISRLCKKFNLPDGKIKISLVPDLEWDKL